MIPGYDVPRATRIEYERFERDLVSGLQNENLPGVSLLLYGSYIRGEYDTGRSDIDGVLTFPDDVEINKANLMTTSRVLSESLQESNIPLQIAIADRATLKDGRFNSFEEDFRDYFLEEGRIVVGPDYRQETRYASLKPAVLGRATFNLRKSRAGLFHSEHDLRTDRGKLVKNFGKGLDGAINATKQIAYLTDNKLRKNKFSSLQFIEEIYPKVDLSPLFEIRAAYKNPKLLDALYQDTNAMMQLWIASLTSFEQMVKGYMKKVPPNKRWFS